MKRRISEKQNVTLTLGQLKKLVNERNWNRSKSIYTVVLIDKSKQGYYVSTVSFKEFDDAVSYCISEIEEEETYSDYNEWRNSVKAELDDQHFYETAKTEYWIEDANYYTNYEGREV